MNFLSSKQAAKKLGIASGTLANWRMSGKGPPYIRVDWGILYDPFEVDKFKKENQYGFKRKRKANSA